MGRGFGQERGRIKARIALGLTGLPMDIWLPFSIPPTDIELMRLKLKASPSQRIQSMLNARQFVFGIIRGRLRPLYPDISDEELTIKMFEEIERGKQLSKPPRVLR